LKNTGEVEDGEYDWMKLNNGKGWEAMQKHPSSHQYHHQNPNQHATATQGEIRHGNANTRPTANTQLTSSRLNDPQPPLPATAMHMQPKRERKPAQNAVPLKRPSQGPGNLQTPGVATPTASTQAQFQASQTNLPQVRTHAPPTPVQQPTTQPQQQTQHTRPMEPRKSFWQKFMSCCG